MTQKTLLVALLGTVSSLWAGDTVGTVVTPGRILINNLAVRGNASLPDGATLKTGADAARIELATGGAIALDASTEAVIGRNQLSLKQGKALLLDGSSPIEALGLSISRANTTAKLLVALNSDAVEVAALNGAAQVRGRQGLLLAMVRPGAPLRFEPGPASNQSTVTGILRRQGARFLLNDELTGADVELKGPGLPSETGHRIQASGQARITSDSPSHLILVSRLNRLESPDSPEPSTNPSSTSTKSVPNTAKTGMSAGTKISLAALSFAGLAAAIAVPMAMSN